MDIPGILRIIEPIGPMAPLVLDVPHAGRAYPADFRTLCSPALLRHTEDPYVDELVAKVVNQGATLVTATFPRAMIDVNRPLTDLDPAVVDGVWPEPLQPTEQTLRGLGLIRRMCQEGMPMYDHPLALTEIDQRLRQFYHPYHRHLAKVLRRVKERFGEVWLIDCHSMPSHSLDKAGNRVRNADFVLGDRDGATCDAGFLQLAALFLRDLGYSVAINAPYKGQEILRRHGKPKQRSYAMQLEINRDLYVNETDFTRLPQMAAFAKDLEHFFARLIAALSYSARDRDVAQQNDKT
jgi:N-formylglutamate deformylase